MDEFIAAFRAVARGREVVCYDPEFKARPEGFEELPEKQRIRDMLYRAEIPGLVYNHLFRKVIPADFVFIMNVDGYVGMNTVGEIFGAAALSKTVLALEPRFVAGTYPHDLHEEPSIRPFIHACCATPEALCRYVFNLDVRTVQYSITPVTRAVPAKEFHVPLHPRPNPPAHGVSRADRLPGPR